MLYEEKEMATHSSTLAWKNPMDRKAWWAEVHGVAKSQTRLSHFTSLTLLASYFITGEGNGNPFQYSCLGNPMDGGAWWAMVHGVAELDTTEVTKHARIALRLNTVWTMMVKHYLKVTLGL